MILLLLLLVVVEAAKKKPSKGELGMIIRMRMSMRRILDDKSNIGMNMTMRTIEDDEVLSVVEEAAKKKPSKGELGMMIRMRMSMRRILDDKLKIGMNKRMRTIEDDEVLSVVVEAAKKEPSNGEIWDDGKDKQ